METPLSHPGLEPLIKAINYSLGRNMVTVFRIAYGGAGHKNHYKLRGCTPRDAYVMAAITFIKFVHNDPPPGGRLDDDRAETWGSAMCQVFSEEVGKSGNQLKYSRTIEAPTAWTTIAYACYRTYENELSLQLLDVSCLT